MPTPILWLPYRLTTRGLEAPGRALIPRDLPTWTLGVTYPDDNTVGAGKIPGRPYPSTIVAGTTTYSSSQTVHDRVFTGLVIVNNGATVRFENCVFLGPVVRTTGSNLITTTASTMTTFYYCDIHPQTASPYWNGIGYKHYRTEFCHVWGCTDNFAAFSLLSDPDPAVHVSIIGTWAEKLSQFKPDPAGARDVTHNDLIQLQGNVGPDDDVLIDGSRFDAYHSSTQSSPLPVEHTQISAIMLTPAPANCPAEVHITARRSWFTGGTFTLNASSDKLTSSTLVLDDNVWERPHPSTGGPATAIALKSTFTGHTITGQTYSDGTAVPIYTVP